MDSERTLKAGTKIAKRPASLDLPDNSLKSCKHMKLSAVCDFQPDRNSNDEETCEGNRCKVPVQQGFSNFHRSGTPSRFLYYEKGHWINFPQHLIPSFVESFKARRSDARFSLQNKEYVLNFEYMIQLNLRTGFARSIAWIDRNGEFFMPAKCIEQNYSGLQLKLHDGRNRVAVRTLEDDAKSRSLDSSLSTGGVESPACGMQSGFVNFSTLDDKLSKVNEDEEDFSFARDMLLSGFPSFAKNVSVVGIYRCSYSSLLGHARLQAFRIQEQITTSTRGDANVLYAWHGTSKEGIFGIIRHGFGQPRVAKRGDEFGVGVYLAPEKASYVSTKYCDVDETGEQHILLCKVIMGKMEQVSLGSRDFHPSSEEFDTGVDDYKRPKRYIVWSTHMNTHILPLFIISFKLSPTNQDEIFTEQKGVQSQSPKDNAGSATHSKRDCEFIIDARDSTHPHHECIHGYGELLNSAKQGLFETQADSCTSTVCDVKVEASCPKQLQERPLSPLLPIENSCSRGPSLCNVPRSPWISFPELFPMLESKLEPQAMNVLQKFHMKFQVGRLPRNLFVKMIRRMLGDDFLRECIKNRSVQTVSQCDTHSFCG